MNTRSITLLSLLVSFSLLLAPGAAAQQIPQNPVRNSAAIHNVTSTVETGEPGLGFRYVKTFGVTEEAYPVAITDTHHINGPNGLFIDESDHLYLAEELGARVLKYRTSDSAHLLTVGTAGFQNRGETTFNLPQDVAVDDEGNFWTVDRHRVAQYDADGNFLQEFPDEDPWNAGNDNSHFDGPKGIAFDSNGRLYVADSDNHRVQVYDFDGEGTPVYSTTLGVTDTPAADDAHFNKPAQIVIDSSDRLYITDVNNYRVQRCEYASGWTCETFHGTGNAGSGDNELYLAYGIGIDDSDTVYIADGVNERIVQCDTSGFCTELITDVGWPADVAVDSTGTVYVSLFFDHTIRTYDSQGDEVEIFKGISGTPYTTDSRHFNTPYGVAVDASGNLFVTEQLGYRLVKVDADGTSQWSVGEPGVFGSDDEHFGNYDNGPAAVAVDEDGNAYVADRENHRIQKCADGTCETFAGHTGESGNGDAYFTGPHGVAVDREGNVYVADTWNERVKMCTPDGTCSTFAGEADVPGDDDSHFDDPMGVAVDIEGNVYVADAANQRIQKCTSGGSCSTFAGTLNTSGSDFDEFFYPRDVAVDAQGRVYVADTYNNRIQVFDNTGNYLTTIGGQWGNHRGELRHAHGVAVDAQGNVYIADGVNHRVQKFAPGVPDWEQVNVNGFGNRDNVAIGSLETFNGHLYAGVTNHDEGATLWRTASGDTWSPVSSPGFSATYTSTNAVIFDMVVFNGNLYAATGHWQADGVPGQIWRSADGTDWTAVETAGFGNANNFGITNLGIFDDALYATTFNPEDGVEIWRSESGNLSDWTEVVSHGLGNGADYHNCTGLMTFDHHLYAAIETLGQANKGLQIWRTSNGNDWKAVVTDGFGDADNFQTGGFAVFEDALYVGTRNDTTGGQLHRSSDGETWTQIVDDGFDDSHNYKIESLFVHDGQLYAGTDNAVTGIEIWETADGTSWNQLNPDGFGDSNNTTILWSNATTSFDHGLLIGTANYHGNGGEIWRMQTLYQIFLPATTKELSKGPSLTTWTERFTVTYEASPPDPPQYSIQTFCVGDVNGVEHLVQLGSCDAASATSTEEIQPLGGSIPLLIDDNCQTYNSGPAYDPVTYELGGDATVTLSTESSDSEGDVILAEFVGVPCD